MRHTILDILSVGMAGVGWQGMLTHTTKEVL
jgi:hypothetical protein